MEVVVGVAGNRMECGWVDITMVMEVVVKEEGSGEIRG
jgi:hypothetical protein